MLIKKMFGLTTILLFFPFARIINGNFQLDDFKVIFEQFIFCEIFLYF